LRNFSANELSVIIGDDRVQDPKMVDDVSEEEYHVLDFDLCDRPSLNPF
jgi:hypothetical protein